MLKFAKIVQLSSLNQIHLIVWRDVQILNMPKFSFCQRAAVDVGMEVGTFDSLHVSLVKNFFQWRKKLFVLYDFQLSSVLLPMNAMTSSSPHLKMISSNRAKSKFYFGFQDFYETTTNARKCIAWVWKILKSSYSRWNFHALSAKNVPSTFTATFTLSGN